ncbi:MAG: NAD+ synthase [Candidatus Bathyarchaeota archaeon]|nr:NAD+ synthase [Candidatus Bathyarchaeota archaeon]MDH5418759.1 NAD+ synthase [Candidatus Bathyarchaeota archaeon]MDH5635487.1 NAD+ synthase [Candidatus Bathyarchaeota archaeon]MDH5701219.1 NAD+ synthase [Candidatus Bathyarchaeota archaeon]
MSTLKLTSDVLKLDLPSVENRIKRFVKDYVEKCGADGVVLGASGGLDSSATAALASLSLGGHKVLGIAMPEEETYDVTDIQHAKLLAKKFDFNLQIVDISSTLKACFQSLPIYDVADKLSKGNVKARIRMVYLYYYANKLNRLVCGASDKSEIMVGYFTKWGDGAADISPIMDLYKTQVRQLALHIGVPAEIVAKPPSPRLWPNQLAEKELGIKYETLDLILFGLEHFMKSKEIAEQLKLPIKLVEDVKRRWLVTEHKRRLPLTTKLGYRTIGKDFRLPHKPY